MSTENWILVIAFLLSIIAAQFAVMQNDSDVIAMLRRAIVQKRARSSNGE